jgi:hypothetical protein
VSLNDVRSSTDAREWAREFVDICQQLGKPIDDNTESWMIGWFANAMMAMHDHKDKQNKGNCDLIASNHQVFVATLERLLVSLKEMVDKGEGCVTGDDNCGPECCRYGRARAVIKGTEAAWSSTGEESSTGGYKQA